MSTSEVPQETIQAVGEALKAGSKIEAIKIYREATGVSLVQAKEFIEKLGDQLAESDPDQYSAAQSRRGCPGVVLLAVGLGLIAGVGASILGLFV